MKRSTQRKPRSKTSIERKVGALVSVINETRALFHRLRFVAEEIHGMGEMSGGVRGVLLDLSHKGPQTVPLMARARPVSRQHIQTLVNRLLASGHVELIHNPAHKRSHLVGLTQKGREMVDVMNRREQDLLAQVPINVGEKDMLAAAGVMRAIRQSFGSAEWTKLIERGTRRSK